MTIYVPLMCIYLYKVIITEVYTKVYNKFCQTRNYSRE